MPRERLRLRSLNAQVGTQVQFYNSTNRRLHAYWIDYQGNYHIQFVLEAKSNRSINTFLTHPWFFRDVTSGELMQVNHLNVFLPQLYTIPDPRNPAVRVPCRKQIIIHFPLQSLKDLCLWKTATLIKEYKDDENVINQLEIPWILKMELKLILKLRARLQIRV